jgi:hypothetical protein
MEFIVRTKSKRERVMKDSKRVKQKENVGGEVGDTFYWGGGGERASYS